MSYRIWRACLWFSIAITLAAPAHASDDEGLYALKGVGALSCLAYLRVAESGHPDLAQYSGYLAGYVSAYNEHRPDTFDLLPWQSMETLMLVMLRRCRQIPDASFGEAVTGMANYFDANRLVKLADRIRLGSASDSLELYEPVVQDVRVALEARGYPTDDLFASLQKYSEDQDFPAPADNMQLALLSLLYATTEH